MLFQSQGFTLIFLPLAVLAYYAVARSVAARQYVLIAASLVFYGWWDARFIPLLVGQITRVMASRGAGRTPEPGAAARSPASCSTSPRSPRSNTSTS